MPDESEQPGFADDDVSDVPLPQDLEPPDSDAEDAPDTESPQPTQQSADVQTVADLKAQVDHLADALGRAEYSNQQLQDEVSELTGWKGAMEDVLKGLEQRIADLAPAGHNFVDPMPGVFPAKDGTGGAGTWIMQEVIDGAFVDGVLTNTATSGPFVPIELADDGSQYILVRRFGLDTGSGAITAQYIKVSGGGDSCTDDAGVTLGDTTEGSETADTLAWNRDDDATGVVCWFLSRVVYNESGDQKLYGYKRNVTTDTCGRLVSIGAEVKYTIDIPDSCAGG